jgi:hypothetical protein
MPRQVDSRLTFTFHRDLHDAMVDAARLRGATVHGLAREFLIAGLRREARALAATTTMGNGRHAAGRRVPHHAGGGRVRPGVRHRDRRLLAQKRTEANLDAAHARPIVGSAPIRKQGWSQRSVPAGQARSSRNAAARPAIRAINPNLEYRAARQIKGSPRPGVQSLPRASPQSTGGWLLIGSVPAELIVHTGAEDVVIELDVER